jgi:hypothetical protein
VATTSAARRGPGTQIAAVIGGFALTEAVMIGCAFAWVFLYSTLIFSGGDNAYYQAHAQVASPVVAVVTAGPIFFAMGRFMRRFGERALLLALCVVGVNLVFDAAIIASVSEEFVYITAMSVLSAAGKVGGAYGGAQGGVR